MDFSSTSLSCISEGKLTASRLDKSPMVTNRSFRAVFCNEVLMMVVDNNNNSFNETTEDHSNVDDDDGD